jgi:hypothetical protein
MQRGGEPQRWMAQLSTDRDPRIRQNPRFTDRSGSDNRIAVLTIPMC